MNKLSEQIMLLSFLEELEKDAAFGVLGKILKDADLVAGKLGPRAGLELLGKHRSPMFALPKGALKKTVEVETHKGLEGFVSNEIGNMAHALHRVSEGVGKNKSIVENVATVGKNFGKLLSDQVRGSMYKTVSPTSVITDSTINIVSKTNQGPTIVKGKGLFKHKVFDRKIEGRTSSGDYIVKKRKAVRPISVALAPVGFGAATLISGSGKKNESPVSRTGAAIKETALWSLAPPVAQAKLISDMLK